MALKIVLSEKEEKILFVKYFRTGLKLDEVESNEELSEELRDFIWLKMYSKYEIYQRWYSMAVTESDIEEQLKNCI